ncbi:MAG: 50S ribosomal protein L4 [Gemmatimonadota bacterium]|nr:50S ribosomal protein L4 [Gemmatimonadota bacterium]
MAETTTTFDAAGYSASGRARERVALPAGLFDGTVNMPVMHQAVKAFLANQRQGNASTKIRKYVVGGNQKPWKQKGTGRARQGSIRAPNWVGGGTVFGPQPRSYAEYVPRQVRALARKSALNARAREGAIVIVDRFDYDAPKTAQLRAFVEALGLDGGKVLILTDGAKENVYKSGRNLPTVHVIPYSDVSAYHILWSDAVVIESAALGEGIEPVAGEERAPAPARKRAAKAEAPTRTRKRAAETARPAAKTRGKTVAKKTAQKAAKKSARKAEKRSSGKTAKPSRSATKARGSEKAPAKKTAAKKSSPKTARKKKAEE